MKRETNLSDRLRVRRLDKRRFPSPTVAFDNPHAVTTHVQPIPSATLHLQLIFQLGRPDLSIASETDAITPISNTRFAELFPGKLSRCQLVADVIGEVVVRHNGHPQRAEWRTRPATPHVGQRAAKEMGGNVRPQASPVPTPTLQSTGRGCQTCPVRDYRRRG
jgi:hypothetical protein